YEIGETLPEDPPACLWEGRTECNGAVSRGQAVEHFLGTLRSIKEPGRASASGIDVVGHRVVHGGPHFEEPVLITPEVKPPIAGASAFAPLHNQAELEGVALVEKLLGSIPQIAVFDTGYHRTIPPAAA